MWDSHANKCRIPIPDATDDDDAKIDAQDMLEDWLHGGVWDSGANGQAVVVSAEGVVERSDDGGETWTEIVTIDAEVTIEADHDMLIRAAGGNVDCDHTWTGEGCGGCDQNPGVWSLGGTTMRIVERCIRCGLVRKSTLYGVQRNPGQADHVEYRMPEAEVQP